MFVTAALGVSLAANGASPPSFSTCTVYTHTHQPAQLVPPSVVRWCVRAQRAGMSGLGVGIRHTLTWPASSRPRPPSPKIVQQEWKVSVGSCPTDPSEPVANSSKLSLITKDELIVGGSDDGNACLTAVPLNAPLSSGPNPSPMAASQSWWSIQWSPSSRLSCRWPTFQGSSAAVIPAVVLSGTSGITPMPSHLVSVGHIAIAW